MAYKIGNYEFRTQKEYDEARKELNLVKQIRDKYNVSDPKIASQLLVTIERGDKIKFKTSIGKAFIELLRKNAKVYTTYSSQVVKPVDKVPPKREQTVNTRYTGTRNSWQTEVTTGNRHSRGGWQTDTQFRGERRRNTWETDNREKDVVTRTNKTQQTETKKIKVKKKNWKVYHTGRNVLVYLIMLIAGGMAYAVYMEMTGLNSYNMMSSLINILFFTLYGIGMCGFIITVWFGLLRIFYRQASAKRLWEITGCILGMILVIALCCTGIGTGPVLLAWSIVKKAIIGMIPTDDDRGLMEVEIEVPVASKPKARKMFEQFEVTGFKEIKYEDYQKFLNADKEERKNII